MSDPSPARRACFFDRDGVLNEDSGYVFKPADFRWRPTAKATIKRLNENGILVFVVTNQSGVARGLYGEEDIGRLHAHMQGELAREGAHIDAFRYCPHHPEGTVAAYRLNCACRKPGSGMILDLLAAFALDPGDCRMFGDRESDLEAGVGAGVASELVTEARPLVDLVSAAFGL